MSEWYYADGDEQVGPVSEKELQQKLSVGELKKECLVWQEGMEGWECLARLKQFQQPAKLPTRSLIGVRAPVKTLAPIDGQDGADGSTNLVAKRTIKPIMRSGEANTPAEVLSPPQPALGTVAKRNSFLTRKPSTAIANSNEETLVASIEKAPTKALTAASPAVAVAPVSTKLPNARPRGPVAPRPRPVAMQAPVPEQSSSWMGTVLFLLVVGGSAALFYFIEWPAIQKHGGLKALFSHSAPPSSADGTDGTSSSEPEPEPASK